MLAHLEVSSGRWRSVRQLETPQVQRNASRGTISVESVISSCCTLKADGHAQPRVCLIPGLGLGLWAGTLTHFRPRGGCPDHVSPGSRG